MNCYISCFKINVYFFLASNGFSGIIPQHYRKQRSCNMYVHHFIFILRLSQKKPLIVMQEPFRILLNSRRLGTNLDEVPCPIRQKSFHLEASE